MIPPSSLCHFTRKNRPSGVDQVLLCFYYSYMFVEQIELYEKVLRQRTPLSQKAPFFGKNRALCKKNQKKYQKSSNRRTF